MASTSESALTDTSDISADGVPSLDVEVVGVGNAQPVSLLTLHEDAVQEILTRLSYDEIARMRLVSRRFNDLCQKMLNKGFMLVQRYHDRCLKEMKAKLPRRESERRSHPLARHIDVLTGIETRLSLLSMTYYKYMVLGVFCFIPGKVLDECYRVLREVTVRQNPPKSYELLQELRDISSMAMEHFEERIVPTIKPNVSGSQRNVSNQPRFLRCFHDRDDDDSDIDLSAAAVPSASSMASTSVSSVGAALARLSPVRNSTVAAGTARPAARTATLQLDFTVRQNRLLISSQHKKILDLSSKVVEYGRKMAEQDRLLSEYGRKIMQLEQKLNSGRSGETLPANEASASGPADAEASAGRKRPAETPVDEPATKHFAMSLRKRVN